MCNKKNSFPCAGKFDALALFGWSSLEKRPHAVSFKKKRGQWKGDFTCEKDIVLSKISLFNLASSCLGSHFMVVPVRVIRSWSVC